MPVLQADPTAPEVSVVMPCLDEARTVGRCVEKALRSLRELDVRGEVIVADNGSTDGSREIARTNGARVVFAERRGYGSALRAGIEAARGRYVIMGDADDSYDFSRLGPFLERLQRGDELVMGNRFLGGIRPGAMPWLHRYVGNPVLTGVLNLLFRSPIHDAHCGLRASARTPTSGSGWSRPAWNSPVRWWSRPVCNTCESAKCRSCTTPTDAAGAAPAQLPRRLAAPPLPAAVPRGRAERSGGPARVSGLGVCRRGHAIAGSNVTVLASAMARPWVPAGSRVLDIGCHRGEFLKGLRGRIGPSVGMDPLAPAEEGPVCRLLSEPFRPPAPFGDASFDVLVLLATLEHIRDKPSLARECWRLLRPGGRVIVTVPSPRVDGVVALLRRLGLADGMSLEEHHGFDPLLTPGVFRCHSFAPEHARRFQLGLNYLFVFRKGDRHRPEGPESLVAPRAAATAGEWHD